MFRSSFALFLLVTAAFAQNIYIGLPTFNQTVSPGSDLIVQVQQPNFLSSYKAVGVVVGLVYCPSSPCPPPTLEMGTILYDGPFNPQYHEPSPLPPYENFTVQVPSSATVGTASIQVAQFGLLGAEYTPFIQAVNQTITIV